MEWVTDNIHSIYYFKKGMRFYSPSMMDNLESILHIFRTKFVDTYIYYTNLKDLSNKDQKNYVSNVRMYPQSRKRAWNHPHIVLEDKKSYSYRLAMSLFRMDRKNEYIETVQHFRHGFPKISTIEFQL